MIFTLLYGLLLAEFMLIIVRKEMRNAKCSALKTAT